MIKKKKHRGVKSAPTCRNGGEHLEEQNVGYYKYKRRYFMYKIAEKPRGNV